MFVLPNMAEDAKLLRLVCIVMFIMSLTEAKKRKRIECPPFPHIALDHGNITAMGDQMYRFQCHRGYYLAYPPQVRCWNGKWTETRPPKCLQKQGACDDPPHVPNAEVVGEDRDEGSSILYLCRPGYVILGDDRRTCLRGGRWSGLTPTCMDESEPLQKIAERMRHDFVEEIGAYSSDSVIPEGRLLDRASIQLGLELVILLDRSSSVDPVDFEIGKRFIHFLLQEFGVRNGNNTTGTRAAVLAFGTEVDIIFNVDNVSITSSQAAKQALDNVEPNGGGTNMEGALTSAYIDVKPLLRERAKKAIFLITDGEPNIGSPGITPKDVAIQLKREPNNFEIFTVGIGKGINRMLLRDLASEPIYNHVFVLDKYADLLSIMKIIKDRPPEVPKVGPGRCGYISQEKNFLKLWPWLTAIYVKQASDSSPSQLRFCSGALICSQWVITAASCFFNVRRINESNVNINKTTEAVFVTLGERSLVKDESRSQMNFYATEVKIHPDFRPEEDLLHNLALIKMNNPAPMGRFRPVCLPPTDKVVPLHQDLNINASIAGWGLPPHRNTKNEINGGTVKLELSTISVALAERGECRRFTGYHDDIFCAGFGVNTCTGDLGSPIVALDPTTNLHHVLGILSRRSACQQSSNQYTELTKNIDWINAETNTCSSTHWMA